MNIAEVVALKDHLLYVKAEDGRSGLFDVTPYLDSEAFAPLVDAEEFQKVRNGRYFVEWACGADLSADTIEARWQTLADEGERMAASEPPVREVL
ncbi:MAG: DUF2442 domain-containing protein [Thiobacillaceae bacterium]|nr:DUF2442 domain-containing protein [Thiobacillaceae bacterium]MCX7672808.1 DUF2442 domain-containing protein [Thiobacillaceae bacterium]MDW8324797.1 DUF2442 domain-containing protein [Burkholderiales bacterium]